MSSGKFWIYGLVLIWGLSYQANAIQPVSLYQDLVAGQGSPGFRDGPFYSALFNHPQGLAVDPKGMNLYVADRENNRVRVIRLNDSNQVETLAGTGGAGFSNGVFQEAVFHHPTLLVGLPGERLVVYDVGNRIFRLLDLKLKNVSTLAGNGKEGCADGKSLEASIGGVWNVVFSRKENALYFTQPAFGVIRKLDLSVSEISTVFHGDSKLPKPAAICVYQDKICVADAGNGGVYLLKPDGDSSGHLFVDRKICESDQVSALAVSGDWLYGLQGYQKNGLIRASLNSSGKAIPIPFRSVWGGKIQPCADTGVPPLIRLEKGESAGFAPDPGSPSRFFVASRYLSGVLAFKDRSFDELVNGGSNNQDGLPEFEYPAVKSPNSYRILIVGSSYPFYQTNADERRWEWKDTSGNGNRMESMPKRLELLLNADAALEDIPLHFEVLNASASGQAAYLPLCYKVPSLIKKYDIDLILYVVTSSISDVARSCNLYFLRPLTKDGIPQEVQDLEFVLSPWKRKIQNETSEKLYNFGLSKHLVHTDGSTQVFFESFSKIFNDSNGRSLIRELMGKPVEIFKKKLDEMNKASTKKVNFQMCFVPVRDAGLEGLRFEDLELFRKFWQSIADPLEMPFLDLSPPFVALSETFWPIDEPGYGQHFNANGHFLFAYILEHELISKKIVPFNRDEKKIGLN